jgi:hypothetical protein
VQRLVIARMQRSEYQQRRGAAEAPAEQNGSAADTVRTATAALQSS